VSKLVKTSVVDVSRRPLRQHNSEVESMSEAIGLPRRVLTAQITVDKHREMDLANAKFTAWRRHAEMRMV